MTLSHEFSKETILWEGGKTWYSCWQPSKKRTSPYVTMQVLHFMVPQTFIEKMINNNNSFWRIWCLIFTRVTSNCPLANMFALKVSFTPMPSYSILFLVFYCGRNVACHGQKYLGPTCFTKSCTCSSNVY